MFLLSERMFIQLVVKKKSGLKTRYVLEAFRGGQSSVDSCQWEFPRTCLKAEKKAGQRQ